MVATKVKSEFTVKQSRGEFYIETGGFRLQSRCTTKKQLEYCLKNSKVHNLVAGIKRDEKKKKFDPTYLPSTDTKWFRQYEYLWNLYMTIENLIFEGQSIDDAIKLGNDIIDCKILTNIQLPIWLADSKFKKMAIETLYLRGKI